jgi:hypothetical protein
MARMEAPPELQLAQMSYVGVDHCVLQAGMNYGMMNDFNASCQRQYPDRFTGLFQVDEPMADAPRWMQELDQAWRQLGLRGLYYQLDTFSRYGFQWTFDDARFDGFWETLAAMRIRVFFEATSIPNYDVGSYIANMRRLDGLLTRFPRMRWLLVMGPPVQFFAKGGRWQFPDEVTATYDRENLQLEIMFPITWGALGLPLSRGPGPHQRPPRALRRAQAHLGLRHAQRRALLHLPAVPGLRPEVLRVSHRRGEGADPGRQCRRPLRDRAVGRRPWGGKNP